MTEVWTAERVEQLTSLWRDGLSCSRIAEALGHAVTRNAVIGKAHRLGLLSRKTPIKPARQRVPSRAAIRPRKYVLPPRAPVVILDAPPPPLIALTALTDETCRFPVGDPKVQGFGFCGVQVQEGSPYCPAHHVRTHSASVGPRRDDTRRGLVSGVRW